MAATITVLLSIAAASIAYAIARQTVMSTRATVTRVDMATAQTAAQEVLSRIEGQLQANPAGFLTSVFDEERARVCVSGPEAGTAYQPGTEFPSSCGTFWTYTAPAAKSRTSVELVAPTPADPSLHVKVLSRAPSLDDGFDVRFTLDGSRRWVWASTGVLALSSTSPSSKVTINGGAYAASGIVGPTASGLTVAGGSTLATDAAALAPLALTGVDWYGSTVNILGTPVVSDIRSVQRSTLSPGALASSASFLRDVACPGSAGVNYTAADLTPEGSDVIATNANGMASHLCLEQGSSLAKSSSTLQAPASVTVPDNVTAYMLVTDSPSVGMVSVYATTSTIDLSASSTLACTPRPSCAQALMAASSHPGQSTYWTGTADRFLGTFRLPVSGVVFADADVFLGVCSSQRNEYVLGEVCSVQSGTEPGMTVSSPLTVVAGSLRDPHKIVVNSTIHARADGQLAAVATDKVVLPYWLSGQGSQAVIAAHLLGVGSAGAGSSIVTFPTSPGATDRFSSLVFNGSVTGQALDLGNNLATTVTYKQAADSRALAPWFGGSDATWRRRETVRFAGVDACQQRKCDTWTADRTVAVGDGVIDGPSSAMNPDPPTGVVVTPSWGATSQVVVSFSSPTAIGTSDVDSYRATCSSSNGGTRRTATGANAPVTVANLEERKMYSCRVEAHSAAGYSEPSATSSSFYAIGPPDSPTAVSAAAAWNGTQNQAAVQFTAPLENGGLSITRYDTTCVSSDGGTTSSASGASPATVTGLTKQKTYTCYVVASNGAGQSPPSASSASFVPIGPPDPPTFTALTPTISGVSVAWADGATGGSAITGVDLRWSSDAGSVWSPATALPLASPYTVSDLVPGGSYVFQIRATNTIGTSAWSANSNTAVVPTAPAAPTAAPTCADGNLQTTLSWSAASITDNGGLAVTGYRYRMSSNGGSVWGSAITATSPVTVTGLINGGSYLFQFAGVNNVGVGAWSPSSSACIPYTTPSTPSAPSATAGNASAAVSWTAPAANGRSITSYTVTSSPGSFTCTTASTTCTVTGLSNGTSYTFTLRATNAAGQSSTSSASTSVTPATVPGVPVITSVTRGDSSLSVAFTAPISNGGSAVTAYQYSINGGTSWVAWSGTTSPKTITGLTNGTSYTLYVRAANAMGSGPSSVGSAGTPYTTPGSLTVWGSMGTGNRYAAVYWANGSTGGSTITSYDLQYSTDNANWSAISTGFTGTSYGVSNLARTPTTYYFRVAATNAAGTGPWATWIATTPWSYYIGWTEVLPLGWSVVSSNSLHYLSMQGDKNLVLYNNNVARWYKWGCQYYSAASLNMQGDTNLVLYCTGGVVAWASSYDGKYGYSLRVRDDGWMCLNNGWSAESYDISCW